ncbi:MAG: amino acid adenylation domain-containing protein, partial [Proteobacteria bacterium]|nr:amino acid adenylation domain-containing protein [Pseudomonadota bacterium]
RADGYVRGEGAGMVVLKPLSRAIADGDRIHAVIRATAVNQDGRTTTITVPSLNAQVAMLREACRRALIDPSHVGYVEAHGTGTPVGDPIEAEAIGTVFGAARGARNPCLIGSIKTNVGHLEPAAGIAGLIKAALCVQRAQIPGNVNFQTVNPRIRLGELGIDVCRRLVDFPDTGGPRVAAVNSFGFGGTNACAIVQQPPQLLRHPPAGARAETCPVVLALSAANQGSLRSSAARLAAMVDGEAALCDVAGTLALRRSHLDHRAVVIANSPSQAVTRLRALATGEAGEGILEGRRAAEPRLAFVFTGQGAHWWAMGRGLLARDPVFRAAVEECDAIFRELSAWSLVEELSRGREASRMDQTIVAQPTTFALQVGLAARWKQWGIEPGAVIGHSIGEMAAAYAAGALSLKEAINVVFHRSRLQEHARFQGGMAALGLSAEDAGRLLHEKQRALEIAAINAPDVVTVAGARGELDLLHADLKAANSNIFFRILRVDYAFHTRQMDPFEHELRRSLDTLSSHRSDVTMYSTVTGKAVDAGELDADYWWRNMREPVLFRATIDAAIEDGFNTFVELGAHPVLAGPVRGCLAHRGRQGTVVASLDRERVDEAVMTQALAELYVNGVAPDWSQIVPAGWNFIKLPPQPFEKISFWAESEESRAARFDRPVHPLLGSRANAAAPRWQALISAAMPRYLGDHRVEGAVVFPAAGYVELCLAAARESLGAMPWEIEQIVFHDALVLGAEGSAFIETSVDMTRGTIEIASRMRGQETAWTRRASARMRAWSGPQRPLAPWRPEIEPPAHFERARFYRQLKREGHDFGPAFQGVQTLWRERGEALGRIERPAQAGAAAGYLLHPGLLDSCFQVIRGFSEIGDESSRDRVLALPIGIDCLRVFGEPGDAVFSRATAVRETASEIIANISIVSETGHLVATIDGFRCRRVATSSEQRTETGATLYAERWIALAACADGEAVHDLAGQHWLLLSDHAGRAQTLAALIAARGGVARLAYAGEHFRLLDNATFETTPDAAGIRRVLDELAQPPSHIVDLWPLDAGTGAGAVTTADILAARRIGSDAVIALMQALAPSPTAARLGVVVAGAAQIDGLAGPDGRSMAQAAILGCLRSIANEYPDLALRLIDIDAAHTGAETLLAELCGDGAETEIALRGEARYACRLERVADGSLPRRCGSFDPRTRLPAFRVTMTAPGVIDNLVLRERAPDAPAAGEALVEVRAVGLNFRDVMAATGLLPAEAEDEPAWQRLGFECAGIVRGVGEGVAPDLVGRRVVAVTSGCFASHVCVNAALVFPIPDRFSFVDAAAVPTTYVTAQYSLVTLGRIRAGECVLIHAAAGGVGLAAITVARQHGARIVATAGSEEKRDYLRGLGIEHVFDSRSLAFADDVMRVTDGYGVDLVLNSLPGAFLEKSLALLAPGGRFLEIGKRDIYADTAIGLRGFRKNIAFFAVDLARLAQERPQFLRAEIETVLAGLDRGDLEMPPVTEFPLNEIADAFRYMAKARQIGKIVVSMDAPAKVETSGDIAGMIDAQATYLVTGGLGGFGLAIAAWLVERGARSLVLVGRTGASRAEALTAIEAMRAAGAEILALAADVGSPAQVDAVMQEIARGGRPLRGVIHAAGIIDDALVADLDGERIGRVFDPKVLGAWNLHAVTRALPLDFFVLLSSVAGLLGSVGQAHYAGANRALDALASLRRGEGLAALSVAWGAIGEAGFLARRPEIARYLEQTGIPPIPIAAALRGLEQLIMRDCAAISFADVRWSTLARANPAVAATPRLSSLAAAQAADADKSGHYLRGRLLAVAENARLPLVAAFVREQVGAVLKVAPDTVELERPLAELGLDSLTSFELKNRVEAELHTSLPIGKFLQRPTAADLATAILERLDSAGPESADMAVATAANSEPVMSIGQEALWFVEQFAPDSPAYGLAMCIALRPQLDPDLVDGAFQRVIARHDSLRLSFPSDASGPVPVFLDPSAFKLMRHYAADSDESAFRQELDRQANRPFDLGEGPLIRVHLYRRSDHDVILLHVHHIIADAASIVIAVEQMLEAYFAMQADAPVRWSRPALPSAAYVAWQKGHLMGAAGAAHVAYWREQLAGAPPALNLPLDFPRPASQRGAGASRNLVIAKDVVHKLKRLAQQEGETLFCVLLAAFNVLLHRLSGDTDIVVGTPTLGRVRAEFATAVGYFVNPVPVRTRLDSAQSFRGLMANIGANVRAALEHQEFPFARIVRDLDIARDPGRSPVFQVMFAMERPAEIDAHGFAATLLNTEGAAIQIRDFKIESVAVRRDRAQFDLGVVIEEFGDGIIGVIDYRTDLWQPATIERLAAQYETLLRTIAQSAEPAIADLVIGPQAGPALVGPPLDDYPDVIDSIRAAALRSPGSVAVESRAGRWTYRQLMDRVAAVAASLAARGAGAGSLVAVSAARSGDLLAAILGVLEVGAAYVPIDITHPPARLRRILGDVEPSLLIADQDSAAALAAMSACPILTLEDMVRSRPASYVHFAKGGYESSDLAYLIHTSGSTGGPLGVEVRRRAVSNFLAAMALELPVSADDTLLAVTTIGFDIAVLELLLPLTLGARVVIADEETARDGRRLAARLAKGDITVMQATPATWQMLIDAGWKGGSTFKALIGGESLHRSLADDLLRRVGELWNLYGPTETTVWSTCAQVFSEPTAVSIGRPIANTTCYVVDEHLNPVPVGTPGELLIAGSGLARGYRNDVERTAARFVNNPFDPTGRALCFRTGDFVRVSQDGALVYLGRRDQQIKMRGFRVELGEIEAVLSANAGIREAAAVLQGNDPAHARIAAFVALQSGRQADTHALVGELRAALPPYMVPGQLVVVEELPRLPNGKIDRARLAAMPAPQAAGDRVAVRPRDGTEEKLVAILKEVLELDEVGIEDDFFAIGGTSLTAMRYLARVSDVFQRELGPGDLMRAPCVAALAELIRTAGGRSGAVHEVASAGRAAAAPVRALWKPLALARAEGAFSRVDAAAIAYLPDEIAGLPGARAQRLASLTSDSYWTGLCRLPYGSIALVVAPLSARELFADAPAARALLERAIAHCARLGAGCVSLTGLIPAATGLGAGLTAAEGVSLTTGHAATAGAMGLTIAAAAAAAGRDLREEMACFVGLGAIGTATLRTLLGCVARPRALILCDLPAKRGYLESLAHEIRVAYGFRGEIDIATPTGRLPDKAYEASFFVGATNVPDVIDVDRLNPGSIVVDDSFPLCFDLKAAMRRFDTAGDVLCVAGGSVRLSQPFTWELALPPGAAMFARDRRLDALLPSPTAITGCILASLMPTAALVRPTIGTVTLEDCRAYWDAFTRLGVRAAPLHCGTWTISAAEVNRFRGQAATTIGQPSRRAPQIL